MKKTIKHLASVITVAVFLIMAFGSDDEGRENRPPQWQVLKERKAVLSATIGYIPQGVVQLVHGNFLQTAHSILVQLHLEV